VNKTISQFYVTISFLCLFCFTGRAIAQGEATKPAEAAVAQKPVSFSTDVAKILQDNCVACHSAKKSEGGYRLDTFHELMQPGDSAENPVVVKQPESSLLIQRIESGDASVRMPPESEPLPVDQIEKIKNWITAGAEFDGKDPRQLLALVAPPPRYSNPPATYAPVPLTAVVFSADGKQVIFGGYHELTVWEAASGKLVRRIGNIGQRTYSIAISPDGNMLAVACGEPGRSGEVRLVDFVAGEVVGIVGRSTDVVLDVAFRPNRDEIAVASADNSVRIFNYKTLEQIRAYSSHADWVTAVAFSSDGNKLISASRDKSAKVFDLESGQMLTNYAGHGSPVRGVAFTADGTHALSVGDDKKLHRWNVADAKKIADVPLDGEAFHLSRRDEFVILPSASRRAIKIELATNKIAQAYGGHTDWVLSSAVSADGRVVAGGLDGQAMIWTADGSVVSKWLAAPSP
jgi:DNA-binding beta-propeller fold protein YncE